jgi:site-specific DNA-cytosine methylase
MSNQKIRFVELCAGIGGMRLGLEMNGWQCVHSSDFDKHAVAIHRLAFGECELLDVRTADPAMFPEHDVLVAGFPCQPFSSSGDKKGFLHSSGNVFESIMRIVEKTQSATLIFENVEGLLNNQGGYSMAVILQSLGRMGYRTAWMILDGALFGAPQTRRRIFMIARKVDRSLAVKPFPPEDSLLTGEVFDSIANEFGIKVLDPRYCDIEKLYSELRPEIGIPLNRVASTFGSWGVSLESKCRTGSVRYSIPDYSEQLGEICCPDFKYRTAVRSVRYYARGAPTAPHVRKDPVAHCLGTNIGAGPTFAVSHSLIKKSTQRKQVLEFSNWHRDQNDHLIFRLTPARAIHLFGSGVEPIRDALISSGIGSTRLYVLLGNLVVPRVSEAIARHISG